MSKTQVSELEGTIILTIDEKAVSMTGFGKRIGIFLTEDEANLLSLQLEKATDEIHITMKECPVCKGSGDNPRGVDCNKCTGTGVIDHGTSPR